MTAIFNIAFVALLNSGEKGGLLDVNPGLMVWTVVTFVLLLLVLYKLAWKPILSSLDEREKFIKNSLDEAEEARKETQRLIEENKSVLEKAEAEAQHIISQGREYSEKLKTQAVEESKTEAKKMIDAATLQIERKTEESFNNLKNQIADIAVEAAEKIIRESLDKEKQRNLINKYIEDLPKN